MKRVPVAAFVALAIVTAAAFFFIQHLKVSTPLIAGDPSPHPATINPVSGGVCPYPGPRGVQGGREGVLSGAVRAAPVQHDRERDLAAGHGQEQARGDDQDHEDRRRGRGRDRSGRARS